MTEGVKTVTKAEHSIRVVSTVTGIAIETLRVWERRYGVPSPSRKEDSNRRLYSNTDIEKLSLVAKALALGFRPGDIIHKNAEEIAALLPQEKQELKQEPEEPKTYDPGLIDKCLTLVTREDMGGLQDQLRALVWHLGQKRFLTELAQPLLFEVGKLVARGQISTRQSHALNECLVTEFRVMLASSDTSSHSPTILLATLSNEPYCLELEMLAVYLAASQAKPRLIGRSIPPSEICSGVTALRADIVGLVITEGSDIALIQKQLSIMLRDLPRRVSIWVSGEGAKKLTLQDQGLLYLSAWQDIDKAIKEWIVSNE
jgi:DNA-binding transcriptional MerR regulator